MRDIPERKKSYRKGYFDETKGTISYLKRKLEEEEQLLIIKAFNEEWDKKNKDE